MGARLRGRTATQRSNKKGSEKVLGRVLGNQARKRHININFLVRLPLGRPPVCPRDKPSLSLGQTRVVPGTNPGFLLILHSGSPVCPRDKPSLSLGQTGDEGRQKKFMYETFMCLFRSLGKGLSEGFLEGGLLWVLQYKRVLRRFSEWGSEKAVSGRCLERPLEDYADLLNGGKRPPPPRFQPY